MLLLFLFRQKLPPSQPDEHQRRHLGPSNETSHPSKLYLTLHPQPPWDRLLVTSAGQRKTGYSNAEAELRRRTPRDQPEYGDVAQEDERRSRGEEEGT